MLASAIYVPNMLEEVKAPLSPYYIYNIKAKGGHLFYFKQ